MKPGDPPANEETHGATPAGYAAVNPYLTVANVPALIEFLQRTFGGVVTNQIKQPDGRVEHAEVKVGDSLLMIGPPQVDALIRTHHENRPGTFYVFVQDLEAAYHNAMSCGSAAWSQPAETFYGDRVAAVTDTNGNVWWLATRKEDLSADELQARADKHWLGNAAEEFKTSRRPGAISTPPTGYRMVNAYLTVRDVSGFVEFLRGAFGGEVFRQIKQLDGRVEHAEVRVGDSVLMIGPPRVDAVIRTDERHRPSTFYVFVADVDETCRKAQACGAQIMEAPTERFYGDRVAEMSDTYGNRWWIAARKAALSPNELQERADEHWYARSHSVSRTVSKTDVLEFIRLHDHGVEATVTAQGTAEAALVGLVVNDRLELFFDTFASTRKAANLRHDPRICFVIGGQTLGDERTVQYEGSVDSPEGAELEAWKQAYFNRHPDGLRRSRLPGVTYYRVRPRWIRYTNFNAAPAQIVVFEGAQLEAEQQAHGTPVAAHYVQLKTPPEPKSGQTAKRRASASRTRK